MSRSAWRARIALTFVLFLVSVPTGADAQSAASISGVVKDTEGAVMPGVSVVIQNDAQQEATPVEERAHGPQEVGGGREDVVVRRE